MPNVIAREATDQTTDLDVGARPRSRLGAEELTAAVRVSEYWASRRAGAFGHVTNEGSLAAGDTPRRLAGSP